MATVFVTVAGRHGTNAKRFYDMFPAESILPHPQILRIDRVVRVSHPSLNTLLQAIIARGDREIVVVSHGVPTQLAIPVMPGIDVGLNVDFVNAILGNDDNARLAGRIGTSVSNVRNLRARIRAVQQLSLERLELRACRVGASRPTLEALRRLFGANTASAPRSYDGYGRIRNPRPTTNATVLSRWQADNPAFQTFGASPHRFFWVNNGSEDPPGISDVFAESSEGVHAWVEAKFASGPNHRYRRGGFWYHIQTDQLPGSSSIHGMRTFDSNFVFPTDAAYWQNLTSVGSSSAAPEHGSVIQGRGPMGRETQYAGFSTPQNDPAVGRQQGQYSTPGPQGMGEHFS